VDAVTAPFSLDAQALRRLLEQTRERLREPRVLVTLGVALALLLGLWLGLPRLVLSRAQAKLAARGLALAVDDVDFGLNGVAFEGARLSLPGKTQPFFGASRLAVAVPFWSLARGLAGVREVFVEGAAVDVDADTLKLLRKGSGKPAVEPSSTASAQPMPAVHITNLRFSLRDGAGVLAQSDGVTVEIAPERTFVAQVERATLGEAPGEVVAVARLEVKGALVGMRPVIVAARASEGTLDWAGELASKPGDALPAGRGRTLARLRALRSGKKGDVDSEPASASSKLWTDHARIEVSGMRVLERNESKEESVILEGLSAALEIDGPDAVRVRGEGRAPHGGSLSWNLRAVPAEARVEGQVALHDVSLALFAPVLPPLPFFELDRTRVEADLSLAGHGLASIDVKGELSLTDLAFASEGLSRVPVGPFSLSARGEGTWTPARRELSITRGDVKVGALAVALSGVLAWPPETLTDGVATRAYHVDLRAQMAKSRCQDVLAAVPAGLLDELASIELAGDIAGKLEVHVDAQDLDATKVDFDIDDACKFVSAPPLLDLMRFEQPFIHRVLEPDGTTFEMETGPGTPAWTPIELISPFMVQAVVAHEDGRFFGHHGFAEPEIAVALSRNLKAHAFKFGASTITMQLVKNVFLHRDKLLARKVQEALITWWLEQQWDKRRILQLYLNVIEYGPALYGIRNAAFHYFGTIPANLTPAQSAFLACVLPSPKTFHEQYEKGQLSPSMKNRMATFLKHMAYKNKIDAEALAFGLEEIDHFTFYDPGQPPPPPPLMRGSAEKPPFDSPTVLDDWDTIELPEEDGSFGNP
jgi:hypothetical protein